MSDYDANPYHSRAFAFCHPDRLAVIAELFGLEPARVETARVLELGCASGGHLWPIAAQLPEADIVGIDLSSVQIEQGRAVVQQLGLHNCRLEVGDINDLDTLLQELGTFDYVIAHGVYSWVPPHTADALLAAIGRCLDVDGIAMVSYNVYPGWFAKRMTREMMQMHAQGIDDPAEAVGQARGLMEFLIGATDEDEPYGATIHAESLAIAGTGDHVMWHGRLAEHNHPCWFRDFAAKLPEHELSYLGDVDVSTMITDHLPFGVQEALAPVSDDLIVFEQYLDFVTGRSFRRSLLMDDSNEPERNMTPDRLQDMHVSARLWPTEEPGDLRTDAPLGFQALSGDAMEVSDPAVKAALVILSEISPATLWVDEVVEQACARIERKPKPKRRAEILGALLTLFVHRIADLYPRPLPIAATLPERPEASALARLQAGSSEEVTNLRHDPQLVKGFDRALLLALDGTRTAAELTALLEPEGGEATVLDRLEGLRRAGLILAPAE